MVPRSRSFVTVEWCCVGDESSQRVGGGGAGWGGLGSVSNRRRKEPGRAHKAAAVQYVNSSADECGHQGLLRIAGAARACSGLAAALRRELSRL